MAARDLRLRKLPDSSHTYLAFDFLHLLFIQLSWARHLAPSVAGRRNALRKQQIFMLGC